MADRLNEILETTTPERIATGFEFTEGPLWDANAGCYYFVDIRRSHLYRMTPGKDAEIVRENTGEGNGTTFDLLGRIVMCEGFARRITAMDASGKIEVLVDRYEGKRLNRPNDVVCRSDGSIYFTDPALRVPVEQRELNTASVFRIDPSGTVSVLADCEYPNGLAFSPDESILYVANSRWTAYVHEVLMNSSGGMAGRRIFADMSSDDPDGVPDGMKVDVEGRVYCTGPSGPWVFDATGALLGIIRVPEIPANLCFGGPDMRTLFMTARTSIYTLRTKTPGLPHPRFRS